MAVIGFDPSSMLGYFIAKQPLATSQIPTRAAAPKPTPPWDFSIRQPAQEKLDKSARSSDPFFDPKDRALFSGSGASSGTGTLVESIVAKSLSKSGQGTDVLSSDNHKLFGLYQALFRLDHIAKMANREGSVDGQRPGLDANFQDGLKQVVDFVKDADFSKLTLMGGVRSASTQSGITVPYAPFNYTTKTLVQHSGWNKPVPGVDASQSFTIGITKGGVTTNVNIDLANVTGELSLDNINIYINDQLAAAGFGTRFNRVQTGGVLEKDTATWGTKIVNAASEAVTLSSSQAETALYVVGQTGTGDNQQGRLLKLGNLDTAPAGVFQNNIEPENGTADAKATVVDASGNVFVVGSATGDFGNQLNQGSQDAYLRKYNSAGQLQWTRLLGASDSSTGYALTLDANGGLVVAGSVTGDLNPSAIGGGKDSFVARYDTQGNQTWLRQIAPVANDEALSVSVDAGGNVYVGGQVGGTIGGGTSAGGQDAFVTKLSSTGSLVYHRQFGSSGTDSAARTAVAADGNLIVASVEDGHAVLTKFGAADGTSAALWRVDLGDLQGGSLGGLTVSGSGVYLSGTTSNGALTAGGAANIAESGSGGTEAFVFKLTDSGAGAAADFVSYIGTSQSEQGGGVTVVGGNVYVTGTTTGTFPGMSRATPSTHNMFVANLDSAGNNVWTQQFGGTDGRSKGLAIAADTQGNSVLDALGLPRGKIEINQSAAIVTQTTARAGDFFTVRINDASGKERSARVTLAKGDTLRSLATKINSYLMFAGKATALPAAGGQKLKIEAKEGVQIELVAGSEGLDLLAGLGMQGQIIAKDPPKDAKTKQVVSEAKPLIGLALTGKLDLLSKTDASHAHVVMQAAMAQIKQVYSKLNDPPPPPSFGNASGTVAKQLQNYQTALAAFGNL